MKASRLTVAALVAVLTSMPVASAAPLTDGAGNPIITDIYTADPDAFVHDGTFYIDTDRDQAPLGANDFVMRDWHVYSSTDAVNWTDHGVRMSLEDFPWANRNAWAPEMVERDGKFFWYVPVQKAATNSMSIAVAVGDSPLGPFHDALGHPLIDNTTGNHSAFDIDPTVLVDDDDQAYIYWGSFSSPRAAKLKPNMIELEDLGLGGGATGSRVAGQLGNAVKLNGSADYVDLPDGIVAGLGDFTISTWVNPATTTTWSRVFDFGTGTTANMFLTVNGGGVGPRFAITTGGGGAEQQLTRTGQLPTNTWSHLAVTLTGTTGRLYVNGVLAATNPNMTLHPSSLGTTTNNWLGRSQYNDPLLNATIDDFQVYDHALSDAEVATLAGPPPTQGGGNVASYRFDEADGAVALDSSGNGRDATIVSPPINVITPQGLTGYWEAPWIFKRNGIYYLAYARGNPQTGGNPATIDYATASNPLGPWTYRGRVLDTVTNTTTNHAAIVEYNGQWYIVYHNGMLPGGGEFRRSVSVDKLFFNDDGTIQPVVQTLGPEALKPVAHYPLDETGGSAVPDATGHGWNATTTNAPAWVPGKFGRALALDGTNQYATLPQGILWNMYDITISAWLKLDTAGTSHVFDFGTGTTVNMYLTPQSSAGAVRFAITTNGAGSEQRINGTAPLPTGEWVHVAVSKSARVGRLYVNGVQVGQNTNMGLYPARLGNSANNWIGRSQNAADPYLDGLVDDVRIYQRGLGAAEVATLADGTPPHTTVSISPDPVNGWYPQTPTVSLAATDDVTGVAGTEYRLDGGAFQPYGGPFQVAGDGAHVLDYRSTDVNGNTEPTGSTGIAVDTTPPTVAFTGNIGAYTVDQTVSIDCEASDPAPGSGLAETSCTDVSAPAYSFALGDNQLTASAQDVAGHASTAAVTFTVSVTFTSLEALVTRFSTNPDVTQGLTDKLAAAEAAHDAKTRGKHLTAFENAVRAQTGKALTVDQARILRALADALR